MQDEDIIRCIDSAGVGLIEITGGEPLLQREETNSLIAQLLHRGYEILIETNGSIDIRNLDSRATVILDIKTPGSGMSHKMHFANLSNLKSSDEVKFVICNRDDYDWSKEIISRYGLEERCSVLLSPASGLLRPRELAAWIITDRLRVRLNVQIHKIIFGPGERKV